MKRGREGTVEEESDKKRQDSVAGQIPCEILEFIFSRAQVGPLFVLRCRLVSRAWDHAALAWVCQAGLGSLGSFVTDALLESLHHLHTLDLTENTKVTDLVLQDLTALKALNLRDNQNISSALQHLTSLTNLILDNAGLAEDQHIQGLTSLTNLNLRNNPKMTGAGLTALTNLMSLNLDSSKVQGSYVVNLTNLTYLTILNNPNFSNEAISGFPNLKIFSTLDTPSWERVSLPATHQKERWTRETLLEFIQLQGYPAPQEQTTPELEEAKELEASEEQVIEKVSDEEPDEEEESDETYEEDASFYYIGNRAAWNNARPGVTGCQNGITFEEPEDSEEQSETSDHDKPKKRKRPTRVLLCRCPFVWHKITKPGYYDLMDREFTLFEILKVNELDRCGAISEGYFFRKDGAMTSSYQFDNQNSEFSIKTIKSNAIKKG